MTGRTARRPPRRTRCTPRRCRTARCSPANRRRTSASGRACPPAADTPCRPVDLAQPEVVHPLLGGGEHLLGPADAGREQSVVRQVDQGPPVDPVPGAQLGLQRASGSRRALRSWSRASARTGGRAADPEPDGAHLARPQPDRVAELPAGTLAVLGVVASRAVAAEPSDRTPGRRPSALWAAEGQTGLRRGPDAVGCRREPKAAAQSWRLALGCGGLPTVAEHQVPAAVQRHRVLPVLCGLARCGLTPRVGAQQLRMRVRLQRDRLGRGRAQAQPDQRTRDPSGTKSVAAGGDSRGVGQVGPDVAPAGGGLGARADPVPSMPNHMPSSSFRFGQPEAAHLAAGVEAGGRVRARRRCPAPRPGRRSPRTDDRPAGWSPTVPRTSAGPDRPPGSGAACAGLVSGMASAASNPAAVRPTASFVRGERDTGDSLSVETGVASRPTSTARPLARVFLTSSCRGPIIEPW